MTKTRLKVPDDPHSSNSECSKKIARALLLVALATVAVLPGHVVAAASISTGMVKIGRLMVPTDSPLARNEHPRLLLTKADIPKLRERVKQPGCREDFELLKRTLDEGLRRRSKRAQSALVPLCLMYYITGDGKYAEAAKKWLLRHGDFGVYATLGLYAYDMLYDVLSPDERRFCEQKSLQFLKQHKWRQRAAFMHALAIYGSGIDDEYVAKRLSDLRDWMVRRKQHLNEWAADRGGDGNSHGYIGQHEYVGIMGAFQAWKCSTGQDWFEDFIWAKHMAQYYVYHYLPGRTDTAHVGINCWGNNSYPAETGANNFCNIAEAKWKDGLARWWLDNVIAGRRHDYRIYNTMWGRILWMDYSVPAIEPAQLPPTMLFRTRGYVCMRSDWSPDAVFAHFHCGRFESDSRNNADNNSFIIYHRDYLACDSGTRALNNPELTELSDGLHHDRYFSRTIAHNSITVGTDIIDGNGWRDWCGGQISRPKREWLRRWKIPITGETLYEPRAGRIIAYETRPLFDYVVGDASHSYSPDYVKSFTRQFVYVRPNLFFIFDRVVSIRPSYPERWYLHTMAEPKCLDGDEKRDRSIHSEGHWLIGGRTVAVTYKGAKLFCKTLLPERAIVRKIGGKGHQFEINGRNYDMYDVWYKRVGQRFLERIGIGWWRIEVEPQVKRTTDTLLHVLEVADAGKPEMWPARLIRRDGLLGAELRTTETTYTVLFRKSGDVGGHLTIRRGGRMLIDTDLAQEVRDNYDHWRDDPRYEKWMTDPYYRTVIFPR